MLIDTHCHLNFHAFDTDRDEVIARAQKEGIAAFVIPGAKLDSSQKAVDIAAAHSSCFAAVGIHPHHAPEYASLLSGATDTEIHEVLLPLARSDRVVAIGEIGLDYYRYKNSPPINEDTKTLQKKLLIAQLDIAIQCKLPVIIHCREAQEDLLELLESYATKKALLSGVFHCFDGSLDYLEKVLSLDFFVGFDGNITYPANENLRKLVSATPVSRLLLETDAPYLTPVPHRGTRNEPGFLRFTAATVAEITHTTPRAIAEQTSANARLLFSLPVA